MENQNDKVDIVRAWKDRLYRQSLTPEQLEQIPPNPVEDEELSDDELSEVAGGGFDYSRSSNKWFCGIDIVPIVNPTTNIKFCDHFPIPPGH